MSLRDDDSALVRKHEQFLQQLEFELRKINRQIIHEHVPELNRASCLRLAKFVAEARSRYLKIALRLSSESIDTEESHQLVRQLKQERQSFEESRRAFIALERAIKQGYVDIAG